jgi:hypothetical protein
VITPGRRAGAGAGRSVGPGGTVPAWAITALLGAIYLAFAPPSPDLAAASYRSHLFSIEGLSLWDNSWYAGHHLLAYSLLAPALGALVGPQLLAVAAMVLAAGLFAALIAPHFPARASRLAALWFALGASIALLSCRVPFNLGLAIGLASLLAAQRRRGTLALVLAIACSLASPVAGVFLATALLAWAIAGPARARPLALTAATLLPIALLVLVFPEGGTQPYDASAFYPALAAVLLIGAVIGPEQRTLRIGVALYALALIGAYVIPSAVGGNVDRLGALAAGPVAALALAGAPARGRRVRMLRDGGARRRSRLLGGSGRARLLIVLAPPLLYWQANAPVADFSATVSEPSVNASYYPPLLGELHRLGIGYGAAPARIEVVPSAVHWDARWVAPAVMLARGWERQLDRYRDSLFYDGSRSLDPERYRSWLLAQGVSYVALPDSTPDYSGLAEARLLRGGTGGSGVPAYLREVWRAPHWRLFAVLGATPLVQAPARLQSVGHDSFTLLTPVPGTFTVLLHFTPYWSLASGRGCIARAAGDWTQVRAAAASRLRVVIRFSLARVLEHGSRCR